MGKLYLVVEQGGLPAVEEAYIREKLAEADEAVAQANISTWDPHLVKAEARRRQQGIRVTT
jgi:hypothetical protein